MLELETMPLTEDSLPGPSASLPRSSAFWFWAFTIPMAYYWSVSTFIGLDDAYIYYRIAENFAQTGRPVFNMGDEAFIATSPLWTLLLAAGKWVLPSLNLVVFAKALSVLCLGLAAWFAYRLFMPRLPVGAALLAMPFLLSHALAGMAGGEIALLAAAMLGALWAASEDRPLAAGAFVGAGILARGEFVLILIPMLAGYLWYGRSRGEGWGRILARMGMTVGVAAFLAALGYGWLAWAFVSPIPQTFAVKRMQGLSGQWGLYPDAIWSSVRRALPGWRLALLPFAALGAWSFPRASAGMIGFTLLHALAYTAMRIPAYAWYYYDFILFIPLLVFLGVAKAIGWISGWIGRRAFLSRRLLRGPAGSRAVWAAILLFGALLLIFPIHPALFQPQFFPRLWSGEAPGERFRAYQEAARRILTESKPGDAVLTNEIGILSYFLKGVEIRDNNGLASPIITAQTMNCWECAVDRYRPRFIVFPVRVEDEEKVFSFNGTVHRYRHRFIANPAAVRYAASVYEREDGPGP